MNTLARTSIFLSMALWLAVPVFPQNGSQSQPSREAWPPPGVFREDEPGLRPPRLLQQVVPPYTSEAMRAHIEGVVCLEAVVDVTGHVAAVHITRSLDLLNGLDEQAVRALERWQFAPAVKGGEAVPVLISAKHVFTLGKKFAGITCGR